MDAVSERLQQLNDEKAELIHELSKKNRSVQEAEVAIADCRAEQEKVSEIGQRDHRRITQSIC